MGNSPALDLDLLRTLALIAEEGSFTRAAERVGRTHGHYSQVNPTSDLICVVNVDVATQRAASDGRGRDHEF
jgi:hypothetical protein